MFGDNLKKYRSGKGLSQSDVAKRLYVTRQCVSKWEKGITQPDLQTLSKLSELLDVSVDELIKDECGLNNKPTNLNFCFFVANILIAVFCVIAFMAIWRFMPQKIPAHWTHGAIDRYGSRNEIMLHIITPIVFLAVDAIVFFAVKRIENRAVACVSHGVIAAFQVAYLIFIIALYAEYLSNVLSFVTCLSADLIMCVSVAMHPKISRRNYVLGVRTTETLKSDAVWNKTNTLATVLFVGSSAVIFIINMIFIFELSYLLLLSYVFPTAVVVVYAKVCFKKCEEKGK